MRKLRTLAIAFTLTFITSAAAYEGYDGLSYLEVGQTYYRGQDLDEAKAHARRVFAVEMTQEVHTKSDYAELHACRTGDYLTTQLVDTLGLDCKQVHENVFHYLAVVPIANRIFDAFEVETQVRAQNAFWPTFELSLYTQLISHMEYARHSETKSRYHTNLNSLRSKVEISKSNFRAILECQDPEGAHIEAERRKALAESTDCNTQAFASFDECQQALAYTGAPSSPLSTVLDKAAELGYADETFVCTVGVAE